MNRALDLAETPVCPAGVAGFYDRYRERIAGATAERLPGILGDMQKDFEREVRKNPQARNQLSEVYQYLKTRCRAAAG